MGVMIVFGLLALVAVIGLGITIFAKEGKGIGGALLGGAVIIGLIVTAFTVPVTNDEGQAKVLRSWTGEVQGTITEPGWNTKAPWQKALDYGVRNQNVEFGNGGKNGEPITIQDKDKVSADIDISVRYSINPDSISDIYRSYGSEDDFISKFIERDISAGLRTIPAKYSTSEFLGQRAEVENDILDYLKERWAQAGVVAQSVSLQDIRYPESVVTAFADAQTARIAAEKANAELEANKIKAESNKVLSQSLTEANLEQLKWETIGKLGKSGNVIIVPDDFKALGSVGK